jgi:gliding motility-associated-like protein
MNLTLRLLSLFGLLIPFCAFSQINVLESESQLTGICPGQEFNVVIDASGSYNVGNRFIVQMSDSAGNFAPPRILGEIPMDGSNFTNLPLRVRLPAKNAYGDGYKIRISSTAPQVISNTVPIRFLTAKYDVTHVTCRSGSNTGRIKVTTIGGKPPVKIWVSEILQQTDVFNLPAGSFVIRMEDGDNCTLRDTVTIRQLDNADQYMQFAEITPVNLTCKDTIGIIRIVGKKLDPGVHFCFSIRNKRFGNERTVCAPNANDVEHLFNNIIPGEYVITLSDKTSTCKIVVDPYYVGYDKTVFMREPGVNEIGCQDTSGTIIISVDRINNTNNRLCYAYRSLNTGILSRYFCTDQTTYSFEKLPFGAYRLYVRDSVTGCMDSAVTQLQINKIGDLPEFQTDQTKIKHVSCNGGSDGAIYVDFIKGYLNKLYVNGEAYKDSIYEGGGQVWIRGLKAGEYYIHVQDGACQPVYLNGGDPVIITEPEPLESTGIFPQNPTCGKNNGSVALALKGGTSPYRFRMQNGALQASNQFNNLKSGVYLFEAVDANGCVYAFQPVNLTAEGETVVDSVVVTPACDNQSNGSIRIYARTKEGTLRFQLNNDTPVPTAIFNNLAVGSYRITVRNTTFNCDTTFNVNILAVEAPRIAQVIAESPLCADKPADGRVTVKLIGGMRPVSFALNPLRPFQSDSVFANLPGGIYELVVKYGNCELPPREVRLEIPIPVSLDTNVIATSCSTATIQAIASGGKGGFQYRLNNGPWESQNEWRDLPAGNSYTIVARDANGCETKTITVTIPNTGSVQITKSEAVPNTCFGRKDASYTIEATGNGTLTLLINGGAVISSLSPLRFTVNNLEAGTVLLVQVVSDKSCPTAPMPIAIPGRPEIQASYTAIGATCVPNSGSLEVRVRRVGDDDRTFEYSLDNIKFQANPLFTNLSAGKYRIYIRDVNQTDCDTFIDAEIFLQTPFSIARPVQVKRACPDAPNGKIIVSVNGGTAPQFSLNGGAFTNSPVFDNLAKGTYTIIAKDGLCTDTVKVDLEASPPLVWNSQTVTDVRCAGESNGSIALMIFGGEPPFQYSKDDGNSFQASSTFDQLQAGVYTIVVRDANDCEITRQVEVKQLSKFSITAKVVSADCKGTKILVTPKDADGKVQYSLTENSGYGDNDTLFTTQSGNITVFAKDNYGCIQRVAVSVPSLSPITFTLEQMDTVRCFGSDEPARVRFRAKISGLAGFEIKDDKGNQVYKLDPMVHTNNILAPAISLKAGVYTLIIRDESNCPFETTLVVPQQPQIEFIPEQIKIDSATCIASDGAITLAVKGGKGKKGFKLGINGGYQPLPQFANLKAGDYTFYVQDENGCEQETTITVPAKSPLKLGTPVVTGSCAKAPFTGKIEIKAAGSNNTLTYRLTASGVDESNNTGTFGNLTPNKSYTVTVTDDLTQCTDEVKDILVPQYPSVLATITKQDESCIGADGKITVTVTQGTAPYAYKLDNGNFQDGNMFDNLTEGTYTVFIRDANGCDTLYPNISISKPTPIAVTVFEKGSDVSCNGKKDGTIRIEITGGNQPYTVNITGLGERSLNSPFTLTDVSAGSYTLTSVKDANGCEWKGSMPVVTITEPDAITFSATKTDPACEGKTDGSITFQNVAGGTPPYQYSINGGANYDPSPNFSNLAAQSYRLVVKDAKGCTTATQSVTLTASAITIQAIPHLCIIRQSGSGSIPLMPFVEPKGGTWSGQYVSGNEFKYDTNTPTGEYSLKYTLNGCEKTATLSVTRLILPEKDARCADAETYTLPVAGAWTVPTGFILKNDNQTVTWTKALPAKVYTFTYQSGNCQDDFTFQLHSVPEADFVTNSATNEFVTDDPVILQATLLNGADVPNATYFWKFGDGATSNEVSPTHRYSQPNSYTIELTVTSVHNCTTTVSKTIRVDDLFRTDLPNVFTPNGDDINDVFPPKGYFPPNVRVTMTILDRFGQVVYRYNSESALPWDAKDVPAGTYFYSVELRDAQKPDRQPVIRQGQITVIR